MVARIALVVASALLLLATTASAQQLVLVASSLPGLRPARASLRVARSDLTAGLPRSYVRTVERLSEVQVAAATGHGKSLRSDGFVFGSGASAASLLTAFKRAHHARRVALGEDGSAFTVRHGRNTTAVVAWREGASVGVIALTVRGPAGAAPSQALEYARLADSNLKIAPPATSIGRVLAQVRPNGSVSQQTALQAFALAYGPISGVKPPPGPAGDSLSGDLAEDWIVPYLGKLPARQRQLVAARLGIDLPSPRATAHAACVIACYGDPSFKPDSDLQSIAEEWASEFGSHLGALHLTMVVGTANQPPGSPLDYADALPLLNSLGKYGTSGDEPKVCRIRMFPRVLAQPRSGQEWTLAHEVFHCFQFQLLGGRAWTARPAAWVMEGMATWAAFAVDPAMWPPAVDKILQYIANPHTPLFMRTYDAVGFWLHLEDVTASFWSRIPVILNGGSSSADFTASGADNPTFLDSWGGSVFRAVSGDDIFWNMVHPFALPRFGALKPGGFQQLSGSATVQAAPYATAQYQITGGPVVYVDTRGIARLSVVHNYGDPKDAWFCTIGSCQCPPNTTGLVPSTRPLDPGALLALTGDPFTGTDGDIATYAIDDFCRPKTPPGEGTVATTGGDPHLITFDNSFFDYQAAGEFTLLKARNSGDLDIQVREQPFPHSTMISVNTAVAMRDGKAVVEFDATGAGFTVYVNHRRTKSKSLQLAGGGSLRIVHYGFKLPAGETPKSACAVIGAKAGPAVKVCETVIRAFEQGTTDAYVRWRDGTTAQVWGTLTSDDAVHTTPSVSTEIHLARDRLGHVTGLIGTAGVPAAKQFVASTGKPYTLTQVDEGGSALYRGYGASWRITQRQSLFTYARGKNTHSYTILNFPRGTFTLSKAPPAQRLRAQQVCKVARITTPAVLRDCEYDVVATGSPAFAESGAQLQQGATAGAASSTPPPQLHPIALGAGNNQPRIAYDSSSRDTYVAWLDNNSESIDVCTLTATDRRCNAGAGPHHLVDRLALQDGASPQYFNVAPVVQPGGRVVVTAEIDGASAAAQPSGYDGLGVVAWSSPAGGSAFASGDQGIADGGELLASGSGAGDMPSGGAVALNSSDVGVYGDTYPFGSGFTDFTLTAPAPAPSPVVDHTGDYGDSLGITGEQVASVPDPSSPDQYLAVVVGASGGRTPGCPAGTSSAVGYGVGVGTSPALQTQAAWRSTYFAPVSCQASTPVLAGGGPAGREIGLLDSQGPGLQGSGADGLYFRRFDATARRFEAPVLVSDETTVSLDGADVVSLSADAGGAMYAAWLDHRGFVLGYSSTGGASWSAGTAVGLPQGAGDVVVAGVGGGDAVLAYNSGGREYLVAVSYGALTPASP